MDTVRRFGAASKDAVRSQATAEGSAAAAKQIGSFNHRVIEVQKPLTLNDPMARSPDQYEAVFFRDIILRVLGGRTNEQWISQYGSSHQHRVNRVCHTLGIPTILLSVPLFIASVFFHRLWLYALALFLIGWVFQFIGHAFEGKPPVFFHDWRFLFVGVRW
jgi:hypothetical protein